MPELWRSSAVAGLRLTTLYDPLAELGPVPTFIRWPNGPELTARSLGLAAARRAMSSGSGKPSRGC